MFNSPQKSPKQPSGLAKERKVAAEAMSGQPRKIPGAGGASATSVKAYAHKTGRKTGR